MHKRCIPMAEAAEYLKYLHSSLPSTHVLYHADTGHAASAAAAACTKARTVGGRVGQYGDPVTAATTAAVTTFTAIAATAAAIVPACRTVAAASAVLGVVVGTIGSGSAFATIATTTSILTAARTRAFELQAEASAAESAGLWEGWTVC